MWIGDTAWELFHKLNREEATEYLENRSAKGFTIIQAVVLAERDGLRIPNSYGEVPLIELDPTKPNEAYFEHVDFIVNKAEELGLFIGMLPTWGDKVYSKYPGKGPIVFNKEKPVYLENIWVVGIKTNPLSGYLAETGMWTVGRYWNCGEIWRMALKKVNFKNDGLHEFAPPNSRENNDWLLVLDDAKANNKPLK